MGRTRGEARESKRELAGALVRGAGGPPWLPSLVTRTLSVTRATLNLRLSPMTRKFEMTGQSFLTLSSIGTGAMFSPPEGEGGEGSPFRQETCGRQVDDVCFAAPAPPYGLVLAGVV